MEQANSSVTVQYSERQSLASCIVSRQAGLTQGFELHAVPVISPPSGRVGRASSQSVAACCMDLRVGALPLYLAEAVWMLLLSSPAHQPQRDQTSGQLCFLDTEVQWIRCHAATDLLLYLCCLDSSSCIWRLNWNCFFEVIYALKSIISCYNNSIMCILNAEAFISRLILNTVLYTQLSLF